MNEKEMKDRIEDLEAAIQERGAEAVRETRSVWSGIGRIARARTLTAFGVLAAVAVVLALVVPDAGALGGWLAQHASWTVQAAFLSATSVLVIAAFLLLMVTVLDPLLIGPEVRQAWLDWHKGYATGERTEHDGRFIAAGATLAGCTLIFMGLVVLAVFVAGSAL